MTTSFRSLLKRASLGALKRNMALEGFMIKQYLWWPTLRHLVILDAHVHASTQFSTWPRWKEHMVCDMQCWIIMGLLNFLVTICNFMINLRASHHFTRAREQNTLWSTVHMRGKNMLRLGVCWCVENIPLAIKFFVLFFSTCSLHGRCKIAFAVGSQWNLIGWGWYMVRVDWTNSSSVTKTLHVQKASLTSSISATAMGELSSHVHIAWENKVVVKNGNPRGWHSHVEPKICPLTLGDQARGQHA